MSAFFPIYKTHVLPVMNSCGVFPISRQVQLNPSLLFIYFHRNSISTLLWLISFLFISGSYSASAFTSIIPLETSFSIQTLYIYIYIYVCVCVCVKAKYIHHFFENISFVDIHKNFDVQWYRNVLLRRSELLVRKHWPRKHVWSHIYCLTKIFFI